MERPERCEIAPGLSISRLITGLWQVADMERAGALPRAAAAEALADYARAGFDSFDMADHYGSAEEIAGEALRRLAPRGGRAVAMTKWCPEPGQMDAATVRAGIAARAARLGVAVIDLLQLHWWDYAHTGWLDAARELASLTREGRIRCLGLTNFDADHLRLLIRQGIPVVSNQVSYSLLDRRAGGRMAEIATAHGVRLLAYGTLAGGFLAERWLGRAEPAAGEIADWSGMKYRRFIDAIGGWGVFQEILAASAAVARRHGVSIANVATRWVLDRPGVAAVIIGARLGEREHRAENARVFGFALDAEDRARIAHALARAAPIPGDCGDEYRRPPFLTAAGDLSHHLAAAPGCFVARALGGRRVVDSGSSWEATAGYARAVRVGERILVSGTTATHGTGETVCAGDAEGQTVYVLDKIAASLKALGGGLADVVGTRVYLRDIGGWEAVARVHGRVFGAIRPVNTLVEVSGLVGGYEVEIEAEAMVGAG